jgi:hypothetical protein
MRTKEKMTICDYIAEKAPNEAYTVLEESGYGFEKPSSKRELAMLLKKYVALDREDALKKLAEIHPDKELIQEINRPSPEVAQAEAMFGQGYNNPFNKTPYIAGAPIMMNASGCGCNHMGFNANGGGYGYMPFYNANGCGSMPFYGYNANGNGASDCKCAGGSDKNYTTLILTIGIVALAYLVMKKQ